MRPRWCALATLAILAAPAVPGAKSEPAPTLPPPSSAPVSPSASGAASAAADPELTEIIVSAPEPRYVAPTLRDRIGRIWAPVYLNGKGPYRLVLDTGASQSAITARVATELGLPMVSARTVLLHGVTGSAVVPIVKVSTFVVGDMEAHDKLLPIVPDALGGADGVLGMESLQDKRIAIDFRHDRITISRSNLGRADSGYQTIPLTRTANGLLMTKAYIGGVRVTAIIDTGGQATVANLALRTALRRHNADENRSPSTIIGATDDVQAGQDLAIPPVSLGTVIITAPYLTVSDLQIFDIWKMTRNPTMLIGIDTLGLLDNLVIDYRRMELQMRIRHKS